MGNVHDNLFKEVYRELGRGDIIAKTIYQGPEKGLYTFNIFVEFASKRWKKEAIRPGIQSMWQDEESDTSIFYSEIGKDLFGEVSVCLIGKDANKIGEIERIILTEAKLALS